MSYYKGDIWLMSLSPPILAKALPGLYRYALELTKDRDRAADLVQDTAERAWRARGQYVEAGALGAWLRKIMRRAFIDEYRKRCVRHIEISLEHAANLLPAREPPQYWHVYAGEIGHQLAALPANQRRILISAPVEGTSDTDVAVELGIASAYLRKQRFKLRRRLKRSASELAHG